MTKTTKLSILAGIAILSSGGNLLADSVINITVEDSNTSNNGVLEGTTDAWYKGDSTGATSLHPSPTADYQEVEPHMQTGTIWDLAAISYNQSFQGISIVSGFDLKNGVTADGIVNGDLLIRVGGAGGYYGDPNITYPATVLNNSAPNFNYTYGIKANYTAGTYTVYQLASNSTLINGIYNSDPNHYNSASQPYAFQVDGTTTSVFTGTLLYNSAATTGPGSQAANLAGFATIAAGYNQTETFVGLAAFLHGAAAPGQDVFFHNTMSCGNDNLEGLKTGGFDQVPDGGTTLTLLGLSFTGLALARKKK